MDCFQFYECISKVFTTTSSYKLMVPTATSSRRGWGCLSILRLTFDVYAYRTSKIAQLSYLSIIFLCSTSVVEELFRRIFHAPELSLVPRAPQALKGHKVTELSLWTTLNLKTDFVVRHLTSGTMFTFSKQISSSRVDLHIFFFYFVAP